MSSNANSSQPTPSSSVGDSLTQPFSSLSSAPSAATDQNAPAVQQAVFKAVQQPPPPKEPEYIGNGKFKYDNVIYEVTLYVGSNYIKERDVDPSQKKKWQDTAQKIVKSLADKKLLPGAIGHENIDAVNVDLTSHSTSYRTAGVDQYSDPISMSTTTTTTIEQSQETKIIVDIRALEIAKTTFNKSNQVEVLRKEIGATKLIIADHCQSDFEAHKPEENEGELDNAPLPSGMGRTACSVIAGLGAIKMQSSITSKEDINKVLNDGIVIYASLNEELEERQRNKHLESEAVKNHLIALEGHSAAIPQIPLLPSINPQGATNPPTSTNYVQERIDITMDPQLGSAPITPEDATSHYKKEFTKFIQQLTDRASHLALNKKLAGTITIGDFTYSIAITNKGTKDFVIEFLDSHGNSKMDLTKQKAYYVSFEGQDAQDKFVKFFTEKFHHRYYTKSATQAAALPSEQYSEPLKLMAKEGLIEIGLITESTPEAQAEALIAEKCHDLSDHNLLKDLQGGGDPTNNISFTPMMLQGTLDGHIPNPIQPAAAPTLPPVVAGVVSSPPPPPTTPPSLASPPPPPSHDVQTRLGRPPKSPWE